MLTVRQSNALVALNKAIADAKACGVFDEIQHTAEVLEQFSAEMSQADADDYSCTSWEDKEHDDFLNRVVERLASND